jgi:hypothetical protein
MVLVRSSSVAKQTQWLHVLIDVALDVSEESATFWSAALGWPLGEPWPGLPEFRSFVPPPRATPTSTSRSGITARESILILRLPIVAPLTDSSSWERSSLANLRAGAR